MVIRNNWYDSPLQLNGWEFSFLFSFLKDGLMDGSSSRSLGHQITIACLQPCGQERGNIVQHSISWRWMNIFNYQKVCIPVLLLVKQKDVDPLNYNLCLVLVNRIGQVAWWKFGKFPWNPKEMGFLSGRFKSEGSVIWSIDTIKCFPSFPSDKSLKSISKKFLRADQDPIKWAVKI